MLCNDKFDKQVVSKRLTMIKPNKMNIGFGLDFNKVKGISKFPIYNNPHGIKAKTDSRLDSTLFTTPNVSKYLEIKDVKHTQISKVNDIYDFDANLTIHEPTLKEKYKGILNKMYGIPDIKIFVENVGAEKEGMVGITNKQFQKKQWKKEAEGTTIASVVGGGDGDGGGFMNDSRVQDIIEKGTATESKHESKEDLKEEKEGESKHESKEDESKTEERIAPKQSQPILVKQVFAKVEDDEVEEDIKNPSKKSPPKQYRQPLPPKQYGKSTIIHDTDSDEDDEGKSVKGPKGLKASKPLINIDPYTRSVKTILDFEEIRKQEVERKKNMSILLPQMTGILNKYPNTTDDIEAIDLDKIKKLLYNAKAPALHGNTSKKRGVIAHIGKYL